MSPFNCPRISVSCLTQRAKCFSNGQHGVNWTPAGLTVIDTLRAQCIFMEVDPTGSDPGCFSTGTVMLLLAVSLVHHRGMVHLPECGMQVGSS